MDSPRSHRSTGGAAGCVRVTLHKDFTARFCVYNLSSSEFEAYAAAMDGSKYDRELNARIAPLDRVPSMLVRLRKAGLGIGAHNMDARLRTVLQQRATTRDWLDLDAVKDRLDRIQKSLRKQGKGLFPYQRTGALWLARGHGRLLADDMGLGKTVVALVALPASAAVVVVCPSSMKGDWLGHTREWRPSLRPMELNGKNSFRWPAPGEVLITNYDILPDIHDREGVTGRVCHGTLPAGPCPGCEKKIAFVGERGNGGKVETTHTAHKPTCSGFLEPAPCPGCHPFLESCPHGVVIIYDEAQNLKNDQSIRHRRACALSDVIRARDGYVWPMTGTPIENEPNELWAILRVGTIQDEAFGSRERYERVFRVRRLSSGGFEWGLPGEEIRDHLRRVMLRRLQKDVQPELPPTLREVHEVELDRATYRRVEDMLVGTGRSVDEIVRLLEVDEIGFEFMSSVRAALATAKIPRLLEIAEDHEERGLPLIVFSDHRAPVDAVGKRPGWVVITGSESSDQKTRAKDEFQNGFWADGAEGEKSIVDSKGVRRKADSVGNIIYPRGIALTIKAGGSGITLTRASRMVFVDRAWNPQANRQAEKRFDRISQKAPSLIIKDIVSTHPLDARVAEVILRKLKLFDASINAAAERDTMTGEEELTRQLHEERVAIAGGRAVRRGAENGRERGAWEALHTLVFDDPRDERVAADLAEQADTIGLSTKQWSYAIVITRKGRRHDEPPRVEVPPLPAIVHSSSSASTLESGAEDAPPRVVDVEERALSPRERRRMEWRGRE